MDESHFDLRAMFEEINQTYFSGRLEAPILRWNSRLRASAGRFTPGSRRSWLKERPVIEVATYLREEKEAEALIWDTVAHEMIHFWLWARRRPYGHTPEFHKKMKQMGVSRYNPVPRTRPYKYRYRCPHCEESVLARRRLKNHACASCCQKFNGGYYDRKYRLEIDVDFTLPGSVPAPSAAVGE